MPTYRYVGLRFGEQVAHPGVEVESVCVLLRYSVITVLQEHIQPRVRTGVSYQHLDTTEILEWLNEFPAADVLLYRVEVLDVPVGPSAVDMFQKVFSPVLRHVRTHGSIIPQDVAREHDVSAYLRTRRIQADNPVVILAESVEGLVYRPVEELVIAETEKELTGKA